MKKNRGVNKTGCKECYLVFVFTNSLNRVSHDAPYMEILIFKMSKQWHSASSVGRLNAINNSN